MTFTSPTKRLRNVETGVAYGNAVRLLDAAHYVKHARDSMSDASIRNALKTELPTLEDDVNEEVDLMAKVLHVFESSKQRNM